MNSAAPTVTLMTRSGCPACAKAETALRTILVDYQLELQVVDVDARAVAGDLEPRAEYGDRLPVILLDGAEHGYWEVEEERLRSDLDART